MFLSFPGCFNPPFSLKSSHWTCRKSAVHNPPVLQVSGHMQNYPRLRQRCLQIPSSQRNHGGQFVGCYQGWFTPCVGDPPLCCWKVSLVGKFISKSGFTWPKGYLSGTSPLGKLPPDMRNLYREVLYQFLVFLGAPELNSKLVQETWKWKDP